MRNRLWGEISGQKKMKLKGLGGTIRGVWSINKASKLSRIKGEAFPRTHLVEIVIPASVEILGESGLAGCQSLSSVTFESGSRLSEIERQAIHETGFVGKAGKESDGKLYNAKIPNSQFKS
jgi:hypothetical protein